MHSRNQLLFLLLLAAVLITAVILDTRDTAGPRRASFRLFPEHAQAGGVVRVTWLRSGQEPVILERAAEDAFVLPSHRAQGAVVDHAVATDVFATLELLSFVRKEDAARAAEHGLVPPRFALRIEFADGREGWLYVGDRVPQLDRVWVSVSRVARGAARRPGVGVVRGVYLIEGYHGRALDRTLDDLRQRRVFAVPAEHISSIEIHAGDRALVLSGQPLAVEVAGQDSAPGAVLADAEAVSELVRQLRELSLLRFVRASDTPVPDHAVDPAAERMAGLWIRVLAGASLLELRELGECPDGAGMRLVATSMGKGCVAADDLDALGAHAGNGKQLFSRSLLAAEPLAEVELARPGAYTLRFSATGRAWSMTGDDHGKPAAQAVESSAVDEWLDDLRKSSRGNYLPAQELDAQPVPKSVLELQLVYRSGRRQRTSLFAHERHGLLARRHGEPVVLRLDVEPFASRILPVAPARFRNRQLLSLEPYALREATLEAAGKVMYHLVRAELLDDWHVRVPHGRSPRPLVIDTLRELARLRAQEFVAETPRAEHGLLPPQRTVRITFDPGPLDPPLDTDDRHPAHVLELGRRNQQGCFARLDEQGPVFLLGRELCDVLMGNWVQSP